MLPPHRRELAVRVRQFHDHHARPPPREIETRKYVPLVTFHVDDQHVEARRM